MDVKLKKLTDKEMFKSTTMFYINKKCEEQIEKEIRSKTLNICSQLRNITSKEGLREYITKTPKSLNYITSVAEISVERFRRIVSMIRKEHGYIFETEWGLERIRQSMLDNPKIMGHIIDLLWNGKNDETMKALIPAFYLESMSICESMPRKLQDEKNIRGLVKRSLEGRYSNMIGDAVIEDIESHIKNICAKHGIGYKKNVRIPRLDRAVSFLFETEDDPRIIIDVSYSVTTTSGQTDKKKVAIDTKHYLETHPSTKGKTIFINFLDGAGWIGRQADLRDIARCSDYVINFNNIGLLSDIIEIHKDLF